MTDPRPAEFALLQDGTHATMRLSGEWVGQSGQTPHLAERVLLEPTGGLGSPDLRSIGFDTSGLGRWDSGLIAFLWQLRRRASERRIAFDERGLPEPSRRLLALLDDAPPPPLPAQRRSPLLGRLGAASIGALTGTGELSSLLGSTTLRAGAASLGRAKMRTHDLLDNLYDAGPAALLIITVVNVLVGAILAFVGVVQLRRLAADSFVANLVGLALVREMVPVMTAIIMAGRTGGAYAARIATMQGNEEIDALAATGIPVGDYIVLPAVLSLTAMMPVLYLYGCMVGIAGGFVVAISMLDITPLAYLQQTRAALPVGEFVFGFAKSIAFGLMIAVTSCRIGMQAGRSAADVGSAATSAVVVGIVGTIALDAVFAVVANAVGH
ncbi:MlaE family ABC transporter permease [Lichenicoccus sp.]|uniref:MlaE family ABC transporter permease n=1 Tax=Lichenicoccus sp. TaxID=2781899 RepID=UPI003D112182